MCRSVDYLQHLAQSSAVLQHLPQLAASLQHFAHFSDMAGLEQEASDLQQVAQPAVNSPVASTEARISIFILLPFFVPWFGCFQTASTAAVGN